MYRKDRQWAIDQGIPIGCGYVLRVTCFELRVLGRASKLIIKKAADHSSQKPLYYIIRLQPISFIKRSMRAA